MHYFKGALLVTAIAAITACEPSELRPIPVSFPVGGGGAVAPAPSRPLAPPVDYSQQSDPFAGYETHGAVNPQACRRMAERFLREGRRVRLIRIAPNPFNKGGGVLRYICIFDGEDASPTATPFEDNRFPKDDSAFP